MRTVLCVQVASSDVPASAKQQLAAHFGADLHYHNVNPGSSEELDELTNNPDVVAIFLPPRPLLATVLEEERVPCILLHPLGRLVRLTGITPEFVEFDPTPH